MKEEWRLLKNSLNTDKYSISNFGNIKNNKTGRILKQSVSNGYYKVTLCVERNKPKTYSINRLVAFEFIENRYNKPEVNHIDGNKKNNKVDNLEWVTRKENMEHAVKYGLIKKRYGEDSPNSKYTVEQIRTVCSLLENEYSNKDISIITGVSVSSISRIKRRVSWQCISKEYNFISKINESYSKSLKSLIKIYLCLKVSIPIILNKVNLADICKHRQLVYSLKKELKYI